MNRPGGTGIGEPRWPIIVDAALRHDLVSRLELPRARVQLLRGPLGVGTSTLAAAVGTQLHAAGFRVLPITGLAGLKNVRFGALAPVLEAALAPVDEPADLRLARLLSLVSTGRQRHVLVVDDAPMLDDGSAAAVYQLVLGYGVSCIMTAGADAALAGPLALLQHEGLIDETQVPAMTPQVARRVVERALGGRVDTRSFEALMERCRGLPLVLRELVLAARNGGGVTASATGLVIEHMPARVWLRNEIAASFGGVSADARRFAQLIAVAQPWPRSLHRPGSTDDDAVVTELVAAGVIEQLPDGFVRLTHPLAAESLLGSMSFSQIAERREHAGELLTLGPDGHRIRAIELRLDANEPVSVPDLEWAAAFALGTGAAAFADRLASQALLVEHSFDLVLTRAAARSSLGRLDEAELDFDDARSMTQTDDERAKLALREGAHLAVRRQRLDLAVAQGTDTATSIAPSPLRDQLEAEVALWQLMLGGGTPADPPQTALGPIIGRMVAAVYASDAPTARRQIAAARALLGEDTAQQENAVDFAEFLTITFDGRIDEALAIARHRVADVRSPFRGLWGFGLALLTYHHGSPGDAADFAATAVRQLKQRDFTGTLGVAQALHAAALAQAHGADAAAPALRRIPTDAKAFLKEQLFEAEAVAWIHVAEGDTTAAAHVIAEACGRGIEGGHYAYSALTGHLAVRLGHPDTVIEPLRRLAEITSSELIDSLLDHAEALLAHDAPALLAAADRLGTIGMRQAAAAAARQAIGCASGPTRGRTVRLASTAARRWGAVAADLTSSLSDRERTIARAAGSGERASDIADRLGLSPRTVNNHLRTIYRKLGIAGRTELAEALSLG